MEGLYLKMTDVYDVIEKLCANGTLNDHQRLMIEIEIDSLDYYPGETDRLNKLDKFKMGEPRTERGCI